MKFQGTREYVATDDLTIAVNAAVTLERPLLVKGEPGTGKTELARQVAQALGLKMIEWNIKSTTRAQQGLYEYDAVSRLRDSQLGEEKVHDVANYIKKGKLWQAFEADEKVVLLIDEIDKADIDFPNDLLTVLDDPREFHIREADHKKIRARHSPIVIITSNKEKANLPAPFLRRCIYSYIRFPSGADELKAIIAAHQAGGGAANTVTSSATLTDAAVNRFLALRQREDLFKKPGTSELLDWLQALARKVGGQSSGAAVNKLVAQLKDPEALLPFPELLFKLRADWQRYVPAR